MSLAQHLVTTLVDDLDGSEAVATVSFSLDGRSFEIDLSAVHLAEFRKALHPFVAAGRRVSGGGEARRNSRSAEDLPGAVVPVASPARVEETPAPRARRAAQASRVRPSGAERENRAPSPAPVTPVPPVIAPPDVPAPRPERKRAPLVADPFNPGARLG